MPSLVLQAPTQVANAGLPLLKRDPLLRDDYNGGVRFAFDLAFGWCYGGASPFVADAVIKDVAERADGAVRVPAGGGQPTFAGGGIDFSAATLRNTHLEIPAAVANTIYNNGQKFLLALYLKLPAAADWVTAAGDWNILAFSSAVNSWQGAADMLSLGLAYNSGTPQLFFRRQTAIGTADNQAISGANLVPAQGALAQLAFWRSNTETGASIRTVAGGRVTVTPKAAGSDNAQNFASQVGRIGLTPNWSATAIDGATSNNQAGARKMRIYRGWVEALQLSGRDPLTVLEADWARTIARGVFS